MQLLVAVWRLASSPKEQLGEEKEMASSCVRADLDWILEKISFLKGLSSPGTGCPGQWWSHHLWRDLKDV